MAKDPEGETDGQAAEEGEGEGEGEGHQSEEDTVLEEEHGTKR